MTPDAPTKLLPAVAVPFHRPLFWRFLHIATGVAGAWVRRLFARRRGGADAPLVGVSLDTAWHSRIGLSSAAYTEALRRAGARVRVIRPGAGEPGEILDAIDGLVLSGGGDLDPLLYGGLDVPARLVDAERDALELALLHGGIARDLPVLGVCRGLQLLNVACGGTLESLRENPASGAVHGVSATSLAAHAVRMARGSHLERLFGPGAAVNSFHGQAALRVGEGLRVTARAPDGCIEGLEMPGRTFIVGVQWHPEVQAMEARGAGPLFLELCRRARAFRARGAGQEARPHEAPR